MRRLFISLGIGLSAGVIDVTPMLIQRLDPIFSISAFTFWIAMGVIIPNIKSTLDLKYSWLKGILAAHLSAIPILILLIKLDPKGIPVILVFNTLLGSYVGFMSKKLLKD